MGTHEVRTQMSEIEQYMWDAKPLHLGIDGPCHHVTRGEFQPVAITRHEAAAVGQFQVAAFAARRLGDQEIAHLGVIKAGRVELIEFHVRYPAPRPPRHGDAVACRAIGVGRIKIDAARPAGGQNRGRRDKAHDMPLLHIQRIDAVAAPLWEAFVQHVAMSDQIDRGHVRHQGDVGMRLRRLDQRL